MVNVSEETKRDFECNGIQTGKKGRGRLIEINLKKTLQKMRDVAFHSHSVFRQLLIFAVLVSFIPLIFISVVLFSKIDEMVSQDLNQSHTQLAQQYMFRMQDKFYQYQYSLQQIASNTIILNSLTNKVEDTNPYIKGMEVSGEITKSLPLGNPAELVNCVLYSRVEDAEIYGSKVTMADENIAEIRDLKKRTLEEGEFYYVSQKEDRKILTLIQSVIRIDTIKFESENLGFIKLDVNMNQLFEQGKSDQESSYSYEVMVLDKNNKMLYSSTDAYDEIPPDLQFEELQKGQTVFYNNSMICADQIDAYGIKFIFLFENSQLISKRQEMQKEVLPYIFGTIILISFLAYLFTRGLSTRVEHLVQKIRVAKTGDLTTSEPMKGNDEIAILDQEFNIMLKKLDHLIKKNYIQQLEKKETELRNLQLQINPHFLYNTLETISSMAATKHGFEICELCEKLGEIFRYSLGKNYGEYVSVQQEIKHTKNYVYIQKTRFGNKFEVFYNVDPEVEQELILRFVIQPIVENAIVHGLSKMTGSGTLEISVLKVENGIEIKIEDDGVGMLPGKVEELNEYINNSMDGVEDNKKSIGIRNVNQRIKMTCGNDYGITIESRKYLGSCFIIHLPKKQGKKKRKEETT